MESMHPYHSMKKEWIQERNDRIIVRIIRNAIIALKEDEAWIFGFEKEKYTGSMDDDDVLKHIIIDRDVWRFFGLLFAEMLRTSNDSVSWPDREKISCFVKLFIADVKMSLLRDALIRLGNYFLKHEETHTKIFSELFFSEDDLKKEFEQFNSKVNIISSDEMHNVLDDYSYHLHLKIPKICFPWYAYAVLHSYTQYKKTENVVDRFSVVYGQTLSLTSLGRNSYPSNTNYLDERLKKIRSFLDFNALKEMYNRSLNVYQFEEVTNLYYIFHKLYKLKMNDTGVLFLRENSKNRHKEMESYFCDSGEVSRFKGFSGKMHLSTNINNELLMDKYRIDTELFSEDQINANNDASTGKDENADIGTDKKYSEEVRHNIIGDIYNEIFNNLKRVFKKIVLHHHLTNEINIPADIRLDYSIYKLLKEYEPYQQLLEIPILKELTGKKNTPYADGAMGSIMNEAYFFLHNSVYETRFKWRKLRNFDKY